MPSRLQGLIVCAIALAGCQAQPKRDVVTPQVVTVPVTKYVPIPAELTVDCYKTQRASNLVGDVVDAYNARGDDIDECSRRMRRIRDLGK
jgi:hypothetical protein